MLAHQEAFAAFVAEDDQKCVGALTLSTCHSLFANGPYGQIAELYVAPDYRSEVVGRLLLDAAIAHGRERGWPMIEVNTPPEDTWSRTLAFYKRHGFEDSGPFLSLHL